MAAWMHEKAKALENPDAAAASDIGVHDTR